jgi:hypothetical protein
MKEEGMLETVLVELLAEQHYLEERFHTANALCMRCHSGGLTGEVLCENGECSVSLVLSRLTYVSLLLFWSNLTPIKLEAPGPGATSLLDGTCLAEIHQFCSRL